MAERYQVQTEIGIDAAHRVPLHASKCKNLHGHRYRIVCFASSESLVEEGPESGMVTDFGVIKDVMMKFIDAQCDHGVIMSIADNDMLALALSKAKHSLDAFGTMKDACDAYGSWKGDTAFGKTYVVPFVPTAENLAKHWYELLRNRVGALSQNRVHVDSVTVWETPTCACTYPSSL